MHNFCMQLMSVNCVYSKLKTGLSLVILLSKLCEKKTYLAYCNFFSFDFKYEQSGKNMGFKELN